MSQRVKVNGQRTATSTKISTIDVYAVSKLVSLWYRYRCGLHKSARLYTIRPLLLVVCINILSQHNIPNNIKGWRIIRAHLCQGEDFECSITCHKFPEHKCSLPWLIVCELSFDRSVPWLPWSLQMSRRRYTSTCFFVGGGEEVVSGTSDHTVWHNAKDTASFTPVFTMSLRERRYSNFDPTRWTCFLRFPILSLDTSTGSADSNSIDGNRRQTKSTGARISRSD